MKELIALRKTLHQYPELSGEEKNTAKIVTNFLANYPPESIITNIGGEGILAIYGEQNAKKTILFRCELDALPIQEINTFSHQSKTLGISHKCGHDGHMAILCGLAKKIKKNPLDKVSIGLLFQPAEENGSGAKKVIDDLKFKKFQPDFAFALHNLPHYPLHQIIIKNGIFTCAVKSIAIVLKGKTSHASEPENGINPALAISEIINAFENKNQANINKENYLVVTPIHIKMGEKAYGVSAGDGEIHFTIRSNSNSFMSKIEKELETIVKEVAVKNQLQITINWTEEFQANENHASAVNFIKKAIVNSNLEYLEKKLPFAFGEDFGLFTQKFNGAMFGLGAGINTPALHNPDYDFPDELIKTGTDLFYQICKEINDA